MERERKTKRLKLTLFSYESTKQMNFSLFVFHSSFHLVSSSTQSLVKVYYCLHFVKVVGHLRKLSVQQALLGGDNLKIGCALTL